MVNVKRGSTEQDPRDSVFIRKTREQMNEPSDTKGSNNGTCVPEPELRVGGTGGAGPLTCVAIFLGHKGAQPPLPQDGEEGSPLLLSTWAELSLGSRRGHLSCCGWWTRSGMCSRVLQQILTAHLL